MPLKQLCFLLAGGKAGPILALRECWVLQCRTIHMLEKSEEPLPRQVPKQPPALELLDGTKRKLSTGVFV